VGLFSLVLALVFRENDLQQREGRREWRPSFFWGRGTPLRWIDLTSRQPPERHKRIATQKGAIAGGMPWLIFRLNFRAVHYSQAP
jgi:hypothetical protein